MRPIERGDTDRRMKERLAACLKSLTGQDFGTNAAAWRAWWQAHGASPSTRSVEKTVSGTVFGNGS